MRKAPFLVFSACAIASLFAQTDRGVVTGTVKDPSGAVVPDVQITAIQSGTNATFKTKTTTSGDFTVPSLSVGAYQVRFEITGFKAQVTNSVVVAAGVPCRSMSSWNLGRRSRPWKLLPARNWTITRYNPKLRNPAAYGESISIAKSVNFKDQRRLDFRWEIFNLLNPTQFGALSGGGTLQNANFGLWRTQSNSARRMQVSLKLYW